MGWGRDVWGAHWQSQPYNRHTAYGGQNRPEWQYVSMLAVYRRGPIDYVGRVFRDQKELYTFAYNFAEGEESHTFTLNPSLEGGYAWTFTVWRGTDTQTLPDRIRAAMGVEALPNFRDCVVVEWVNIDLGQGSTAIPSLELELGCRAPAFGDFPGGAHDDYGVNPFAALYAYLMDDAGGAGLGAEYLPAAAWSAAALALEADGVSGRTGAQTYIHPTLSARKTVGSFLAEVLGYIDGFAGFRDGCILPGWFAGRPPAVATLTEIAEHDLEDRPSGPGFGDWNQGATSVDVVFKSAARGYQDDVARYIAAARSDNSPSAAPARKDRPFVHDAAQAALIAAEQALGSGEGAMTVDLAVLQSRAVTPVGAPLAPGDLVNWDYAPNTIDLVCRVVTVRHRPDKTSDLLTLERERGAFPRPYVAPAEPRALVTPEAPGGIAPGNARLWFLPTGFGATRQIAALIDRHTLQLVGARLHMSASGTAPWAAILDARGFAAKCSVANNLTAVAATVRLSSVSLDIARMQAQDTVAQADDTLCLLVDDELLSVSTLVAVSPGVFDLGIARGRRDTSAAVHAPGAVAWLFYRAELPAVAHGEFYRVRDGGNTYNAGLATKYFKLQAYTASAEGDPSPDDPGIALQLPDLAPDETAGYTVTLTAPARTIACAADGTPVAGQLGAGGTARTDIVVYRGATALTPVAATPNSDQFSITLGAGTNAAGTKEDNDTIRADYLTADAGSLPVYVNCGGVLTIPKVFALAKARAGAKGDTGAKGDAGDAGAAGAAGAPGPGVVYRGPYDAAKAYYHTATRRDVVSAAGAYYLANNPAKSGLATWGGAPGADWVSFGANFESVATKLLLAEDATILRTLVMGDATGTAGLIRSYGASAYNAGAGYWIGPDGKFRVGDPAGSFLGYDGASVKARFGSGENVTVIDDNKILFGDVYTSPQARRYFRVMQSGGGIELYMQDATEGNLSAIMAGVHPTWGSFLSAKDADGNAYFLVDETILGVRFGAISLWRAASDTLQTDAVFVCDGIRSPETDGYTLPLYCREGNDWQPIQFKKNGTELIVRIHGTDYVITKT